MRQRLQRTRRNKSIPQVSSVHQTSYNKSRPTSTFHVCTCPFSKAGFQLQCELVICLPHCCACCVTCTDGSTISSIRFAKKTKPLTTRMEATIPSAWQFDARSLSLDLRFCKIHKFVQRLKNLRSVAHRPPCSSSWCARHTVLICGVSEPSFGVLTNAVLSATHDHHLGELTLDHTKFLLA